MTRRKSPTPKVEPQAAGQPAYRPQRGLPADATAIGRLFGYERWSPFDVDDTPATMRYDLDDTHWTEADARIRLDGRAADVVWAAITGSELYGRQMMLLDDEERMGGSFHEFLFLMVRHAAQAGALYAMHVDPAVVSGAGRWSVDDTAPMEFRRAVRALAAIAGLELLPEPSAESERAEVAA